MSCKYCNLKRRKDGDVEWIAGEEWKSESDDGGYICPHDNGFRMLVYYDARCACTAVDDIKYCPFCGAELTIPAEPIIKDEEIISFMSLLERLDRKLSKLCGEEE